MRIAVCAAILLAIVSGGSADSAVSGAMEYQGLHTIAVASVLGHVPMRVNGFSWRRPDLRVPGDWTLDDFVTTLVANALRHRFVVVRVPARPGAAADFAANPPASPFEWLRTRLNADPLFPAVDAYILVYPIAARAGDATWNGLALTHQSSLFGPSSTWASAAFAIALYDVRTGNRIGYGQTQAPDIGPPSPAIVESCDNDMWAARPGDLTSSRQLQIDDEFHALIAKSLPAALIDAHLLSGWRRRLQIDTWNGRPLACRPA